MGCEVEVPSNGYRIQGWKYLKWLAFQSDCAPGFELGGRQGIPNTLRRPRPSAFNRLSEEGLLVFRAFSRFRVFVACLRAFVPSWLLFRAQLSQQRRRRFAHDAGADTILAPC